MDAIANAIHTPKISEETNAQLQKSNESGTFDTTAPHSITLDDIRQILRPREVDFEVLGPKLPEDIARINKRLLQAWHDNSEWFKSYLKTHAVRGAALPYDARFGITEDEYRQLQDYSKKMKYVPLAKGRLKFEAQSESKILIENIEGLPEFHGVSIDLARDEATTPWGRLPVDTKPVHTSDSAIGGWDSHSWRLEPRNADSGAAAMMWLDIGRHRTTPHDVINFRALVVVGGVKMQVVRL